MPLSLTTGAPTIIVRREAFEAAGLSREAIDRALVLTPEEFRVERDIVTIGPIYNDEGLAALVRTFEDAGLAKNPLPFGLFRFCREYWVDLERGVLEHKDWHAQNPS